MSPISPAKFGAVAALLVLFAPSSSRAANYYVAPSGSDSAAGSEAAPFATVGRGQTAAAAGDTVFIRGGVYTISSTSATIGVAFSKSGQQNNRINYFAYPGEIPIFDLFNLLPQARVTGFDVTASWIHIRGIEIRGTQQIVTGDSWGVRIRGSNNIVENMNVHHGEAPGFFITSGSNNTILNCDSHHNYDPLEGGGNGDGFGCHSPGGGNVISGCRGWSNSDDGYDFINADGSCTVEKSWAWSNGYVPDTTTASGNGAGFKAGGYGSPPTPPASGAATHTVRQCVAFANRAQGFYGNHHPGRINFYNNTAFNNSANFNMLSDSGYPSDHVIRNNVATGNGGTISNLNGGTATFNSWNLSVTVNAMDFVNMTQAEASQPRQADGSLPNVGFMHLVAGSDLIDKGTDVGLPFVGAAPDLGAFEFGASGGAGGATGGGTGGAPGTGGAGGRAGTGGGAGRGGAGGLTGSGGGAGRAATGGTTGTAGAGGSAVAGTGGGVTGSGGGTVAGSGGGVVAGTGGAGIGTGGAVGPGGTGGAGAAFASTGGSGTAGGPGVDPSIGGCGCRVTGAGEANLAGAALLSLAMIGIRLRRRTKPRAR